jgi:hypothetical protein
MRTQPIYQSSIRNAALRQGEILTNVVQYYPVGSEGSDNSEQVSFKRIVHPYAIVATQDCDLDWDYRARQSEDGQATKLLNSIILCVVDTAKTVRGIGNINSKEWNLVEKHRHEQFYFFEKIHDECDLEQEGLPELTADFKRVFGIEAADLYRQIDLAIALRRSTLSSPYLEHFSRRYSSFHSRVALPSQYESERGG